MPALATTQNATPYFVSSSMGYAIRVFIDMAGLRNPTCHVHGLDKC